MLYEVLGTRFELRGKTLPPLPSIKRIGDLVSFLENALNKGIIIKSYELLEYGNAESCTACNLFRVFHFASNLRAELKEFLNKNYSFKIIHKNGCWIDIPALRVKIKLGIFQTFLIVGKKETKLKKHFDSKEALNNILELRKGD